MINNSVKSDSILKKRIRRFKSIKRGYYSFIVVIALYMISFLLPIMVNSKALVVCYANNEYDESEPFSDENQNNSWDIGESFLDKHNYYFPAFSDLWGGIFSSKGGINPKVYAEFDTPGEVASVYSYNNTIFAGLKYSNGCLLAQLNENGIVENTHGFAIGYSVNGIHHHNGLLALAAGHDGILLYNWSDNEISFKGTIETAYANNVKIVENIIFAATEDGIEIIQIDF